MCTRRDGGHGVSGPAKLGYVEIVQWRKYPLASRYEISDHGGVRNPSGYELTQYPQERGGHLRVKLYYGGKKHWRFVHHLVLETFEGPCPDGKQARHLNGKPTDNCWPRNLIWGWPTENYWDRRLDNIRWFGAGSAKLDEGKVMEIRAARICGSPVAELAELYGVSESTIRKAANGRSWAWL